MAGQDWFDKDFYADLGVTPEVDAATLKKAYRKLARQHHPDSSSGNEARFKAIGEAYSVLSDPEQRQEYDAIRTMSRGGPRFAPGGGGGFEDVLGGLFAGQGRGRPAGRQPGGFGKSFNDSDLEDLFRGMGGFDGFGGPSGPSKGADVSAVSRMSFRDAVLGTTVNVRTPQGASVTARIPAGVRNEQRIRLRGKGAEGSAGGPPGDLMITVEITPDPIFSRQGDDLVLTAPVTFPEAALGATIEVPTLAAAGESATVRVKIAPGTPSGRTLRVKGRGIKHAKGVGDLRVVVQVAVPQRLSDEARTAVEAYAQATASQDPRADLLAANRGAGSTGG